MPAGTAAFSANLLRPGSDLRDWFPQRAVVVDHKRIEGFVSLLQDEPGADQAEPMLMEGLIGAANWSEVLQKAGQHGAPSGAVARLLVSFGLTVAEVTRADAEIAAGLWNRGTPLSLADRLCLALGVRRDLPVATADTAWTAVENGPNVLLVR